MSIGHDETFEELAAGYALGALDPADEAALAALVQRFSPETMRRRFLSPKQHLSPADLRRLARVDQRDHIPVAAVAAEDPARLLGVARCVRLAPGGDVAEFAIAVADEHQRQGLGTVLASALAEAAHAAGIRRFAATTLAENDAAVRLMRTFAAHLHDGGVRAGVRELTLDLAA